MQIGGLTITQQNLEINNDRVKISILIFITFLAVFIAHSSNKDPENFIIYGRAISSGEVLSTSDTSISLRVGNVSIANYTLGSNRNRGCCFYELIIPLNSELEKRKFLNREVSIYINDKLVPEKKLRIGNPGKFEYLEISE